MEGQLPGNANVCVGQASFQLVSTKPEAVENKEKNEGTITWKHFILNIEGFHFENQLEAGLATWEVAFPGSCPTKQSVQIKLSSILICHPALT